jgi:CheY-like chemotaxis protein
MLGMDGLETMRHLRQAAGNPNRCNFKQRFFRRFEYNAGFFYIAKKLGATASLGKPFRPAELLSTVAKISRSRGRRVRNVN